MPITFRTQTIAEYAKEFPSKTAFKKDTCSICRCSIKATKQPIIWTHEGVGSNRHAHHIECLTPWLAIKNSCPCCNQENNPSWKQQALNISKRVFVNGLGAGLMVGTFGFLNNTCFDLVGPFDSLFGFENNTLFSAAIRGGLIESLLNYRDPFEDSINKTRFVSMTLLTGVNLLFNARNPVVAFGSIGAMFLGCSASHSLHKAGATMRGLAVPMGVAHCISTFTSSIEIPLPTLPLTALATFLGIIGSLQKD